MTRKVPVLIGMSREMIDALDAERKRYGCSRAELVRLILQEMIAELKRRK